MKLSVNILCLNTFDTLINSLDILCPDLKYTSHEIIIVDNGSTDDLKGLDKICENTRVIRNEVNLGISKGKNQGILASQGDYIFLLDGDVVPVAKSVLMLLDYLEENEECAALGFMPNKFALHKNRDKEIYHEEVCRTLFNPRHSPCACLYYGMYRRNVFDKILLSEDGEFGQPGYGWEDHDFYEKMKQAGIIQWVCGMNHEAGKYYHKINSSIKVMGHETYMETSKKRSQQFKEKWENKECLIK